MKLKAGQRAMTRAPGVPILTAHLWKHSIEVMHSNEHKVMQAGVFGEASLRRLDPS